MTHELLRFRLINVSLRLCLLSADVVVLENLEANGIAGKYFRQKVILKIQTEKNVMHAKEGRH